MTSAAPGKLLRVQRTLCDDDWIDGQGPHRLRKEQRVISPLSRNLIRCRRNAAPRREKIMARELGRWPVDELKLGTRK